jgi:hypothetical protein
MADDPSDPPDAADPAEAEIVAYLDGELDAAAARRVEARLAADPALRARAEALKRSYDLLDFLPKPEPSPAFATRTLDRLPAVKSSPAAPPVSVPVSPPSGTGTLVLTPVPPPRSGAWALALLVLIGVSLGLGYLGTAAARAYLFPAPPLPPEPTADTLPLADYRVVERLALYAPADDLDFVEKLAEPDRFGDDVGAPSATPVEPDKPDGRELDALVKAYRDLPAERQDKLRQLDQQLYALPDARRDKLLRVLEVYAAWLQRLSDGDRKKILSAAAADDRLEAIDDTRRTLWVAGLPAAQRHKLKASTPEDRATLILKWKAEEDASRTHWNTARLHHEFLRSGRPPWPFTEDAMKKQVLDFAQSAYHPGDPKRNRLQPADVTRFHEAVERAEKGGEWAWLGKTVYDFSRNSRYETFPEAGPNGKMVTDFADLPAQLRDAKGMRLVTRAEVAGRWPDFALEVNKGLAAKAKFGGKFGDVHLGPAKPAEFKPEVEQFLPELRKKAGPTEWAALAEKEGKWPDYPTELLRLARVHDLSVPGAMPPGPPSQWEKTYSLPARPVPRPGSE